MSRRIKAQLVPLGAVLGLIVIASAIGFSILREQRLRLPWDDRYTVKAELSSGQALTPGQGQSITVAGVEVGEIAKVTLRDGRALVEMSIERPKLAQVRSDATLFIRPRTPLQDMTVDVDPGSSGAPVLGEDDVIPVAQTTPQVNLDEILAALDVDTRRWAVNLVSGFADGVRDQGDALQAALKASAPTLALTRRVTAATADRRRQLARAIHSLRTLTTTIAGEERSLGTFVTAGEATFTTLASEDDALREGLRRLPGTLRSARSALAAAEPFSSVATPAFERLVPVARTLPGTLRALDPLQRDATPTLRRLVSVTPATRRVARDLAPAAGALADASPDLQSALATLDRFGDILAYNPEGPEEGYLFWASWFLHNAHSFISGQDGNGPFWRGIVQFSCSSAFNEPLTGAILRPILEAFEGLPDDSRCRTARGERARAMNKQAPKLGQIAVMTAFALSCFGLLLFLWVSFGGPTPVKPKGYRVGVPMKEVVGIGKAADVRISGVPVGKVTGLRRDGDRTRVEIELQPRYAPLPDDARATLRRKTLLGEAFIELTPGSAAAPKLREGENLAVARVEPSVEVDELFLAFEPETRGALRAWLQRWQGGLDGRAPEISGTLAHLPGLVQEGGDLLSVLRSQSTATSTILRDTGRTFDVVGRRGARTQELIRASRDALQTTASREADLAATARALPPALRELRRTLASAQRLSGPLAPVLADLRPAVRRLGPTLERAAIVGPQLRRIAPLLDDVVAAARSGLPATSAVIKALGPLLERTHPFGREAAPLAALANFYKVELANSWGKVGAAVQAKNVDATTGKKIHYLRAVAVVQNETLSGVHQRQPYSRPNAYLAPGGVDALITGPFKSFDCSHTKNPVEREPLGGFAPCVEQGPLTFMGRTSAYPQVRPSP